MLVIGGDLNVAPTDADLHPSQVKAGTIGQRPDERALLSETIGHRLIYVILDQHPAATDLFTWWAPWRNLRDKNVGWRIDFVLASTALANTVTSCVVRKEVLGSDHAPVVVELTGV